MYHEATALDLPGFSELPKREKTRLEKIWDHFQAVREVVEKKGMLVPQHVVADLLGVSRQRVHVLVNEGRLEAVQLHGNRYVTEESFIAFSKVEREIGRPLRLPQGVRETWKWARATTTKKTS